MRVHDLMNRDVITCSRHARLDEAVALMSNKDCGFLPVVDGGVVVGVLTHRDVAISAWRHGVRLNELRVSDAMTADPVVVVDEETIEGAEELMCSAHAHRLPVVDAGGRLLGVVSLADLARTPRRGGGSSHRDDVVVTLSALARRRPSTS